MWPQFSPFSPSHTLTPYSHTLTPYSLHLELVAKHGAKEGLKIMCTLVSWKGVVRAALPSISWLCISQGFPLLHLILHSLVRVLSFWAPCFLLPLS